MKSFKEFLSEVSGIKFTVVWTDRNYNEKSKSFTNSKMGSPDEAEKKARAFAAKLEKDENNRSVSVKSS